ncbi:nucleoside diphosphate kinase [Gregarina niphandrodes]|uniref:nucleoside-diphosphate kinase n=1 Tax=Gregarina niphandrodes TaxID=110365 RepID=A0A023B6F3_GRENI|nr:nucleoside diphosphate kinase [Gregarina niphandrodes]EZG66413.1 nucleoside diphosphate kinase [Gregarina niphandrodes]|eukprot:XP_011134005.1 nucleoside diphosphate kinase [Gregarina niphandrodes]
MAIERTFVAVKPDGVRRGLISEVMKRYQNRGYVLCGAKLVMPSDALVREHYKEHEGKPFLPGLLAYVGEGPVFAMAWEGENVIDQSRKLIGATKPGDAELGTIRGDFAQVMERNIVHSSDSKESAEREINLWFKPEELCKYNIAASPFIRA